MQSTTSWDGIVVGAGPAGAVAAYLLARSGLKVLLVEAKRFPREKVCGGCLNPRALDSLEAIGLGDLPRRCGGRPYHRVRIRYATRGADVPLPGGLTILRSTFDAALVEAAVTAGATFVSQAKCKVLPVTDPGSRSVHWHSNGAAYTATAPVILACDGLGHPSLQELPEFGSIVSPQSYIGLGANIERAEAVDFLPSESILLAVASNGYAGVACAEQGRLIIAAAINPATLSDGASPLESVAGILHSAGLSEVLADCTTPVRGTLPITQHSTKVAAERLLLIGDAAGYVEPFTGEGMAAAIEGALLAVPIAEQSIRTWQPELAERWQRLYARRIRSRQLACRTIAWLLRHPHALRWSLSGLATQPRIGTAIGRWIARSTTSRQSLS